MTERRYSEEEVAAIFKRAAEAQQSSRRQLPAGEGMTLRDLQGIGREVGIPPELVAQAAAGLEARGLPASRRFIGLPIGVGRTVQLDRPLTDQEWERLVVDLRQTFDAKGQVRVEGSLRQWTNGNLQALLEPTATGYQLRLRTVNGNARGFMGAGLAMIAIALGPLVVSAFSVGLGQALSSVGPLAMLGAGFFAVGAARLPRWSRVRALQMEEVAARLAEAVNETAPGERLPPDPED
jgi:hypothetical protein